MEHLQVHYVDLGVQRVADVRPETSIGRTEGNDIVLNHPSVSRKHAKIELRGTSAWWIVDLKSTNGVKINGNLVTESQVNPGDQILIGSVQLELKPVPSVNFSNESMFDNPQGTVIRRISDFNSEFGLGDEPVAPRKETPVGLEKPEAVSREKIFQVLVQVARAMLQSDDLNSLLNIVMDMIFKYLPVERGLLILFDEKGEPIPKVTKFADGTEHNDIPISKNILNMVSQQQVAFMTSNALEDARLLGGKSIAIHGIRSAMCVPLWNRNRVIGAVQVDSPIHIGSFTEEDLDLLTALANFSAVAIERAQLGEKIEEEKKIRDRMARYHSPAVVDEIVKGTISADASEIKSVEVSILFADISGFTTVSESKRPEEVAEFLSHFLGHAVESIFAFGGTLDKFIGDAVMAFFGAPIHQDDHADRAVLAGLMLQRLVNEWNEERAKVDLPPVKIRVGINSGPAVVGNVGTEKRVDYTVLGSSVNIASRLESGVAKPGQVVISKNTLERVMGSFKTESLGEFALKGLQQKMPVFAVLGSEDGAAIESEAGMNATRAGATSSGT
jgi:adenylate cyclase